MPVLAARPWLPAASDQLIGATAAFVAHADVETVAARIDAEIRRNRVIHEQDCINLNPGTNAMNPRAEAALASGLGSRPSLGYPGDKYEMGLEAIEQIEIIAAELAAEVFGAKYVEYRVPSGAIANLYAFMAVAKPGDAIIVPPASIGGHVTHHLEGCAGLYGLDIHPAPVDADGFSVELEGLRALAQKIHPKLITIGCSLNLFPHPVRDIRAIADQVGAKVLYDAAHVSGMIAGKAWQQPLAEGAHILTMSTYKSLGGPASGLVLTNDAALAEKLDRIAYPGMTANFDAAKAAALAITLLDWKTHGQAYGIAMTETAQALSAALAARGLPVFTTSRGATQSHQFALRAEAFGGGQTAAKRLRAANILSCGIGLPGAPVAGDTNGLRFGTNEVARWGMNAADMPALADLVARALTGNVAPETLAAEVTAFRRQFNRLHFVRA